jgi:hypothetical protein
VLVLSMQFGGVYHAGIWSPQILLN